MHHFNPKKSHAPEQSRSNIALDKFNGIPYM